MIDVAPDLFHVISRRRPRSPPTLNLNIGAFAERLDDLSLIEEAAFWRLYRSYWRNGELPADPARLAAICKVTSQRWKRIAVAMELVFDIDASGRLRDPDLEEQRAAAIAKSERNARSARERWDAGGDANADANASLEPRLSAGRIDASDAASAVVPFSRGKEVRKEGHEEDQSSIPPSSLPSSPAAGTADAAAIASLPDPDRGAVSGAPADASAGPRASADASHARTISNADLAARLREACRGKVAAAGLRPNGFRKIRALMVEGFDLDGEILPALTANIDTVDQLQHFGSSMVRGWVEDYRAEMAERAARPGTRGKVFVSVGSPGWAAHEAVRRAAGDQRRMQSVFSKEHNCNGWFFDAAFPNITPIVSDELPPPKPPEASRTLPPVAGAEERDRARGG